MVTLGGEHEGVTGRGCARSRGCLTGLRAFGGLALQSRQWGVYRGGSGAQGGAGAKAAGPREPEPVPGRRLAPGWPQLTPCSSVPST